MRALREKKTKEEPRLRKYDDALLAGMKKDRAPREKRQTRARVSCRLGRAEDRAFFAAFTNTCFPRSPVEGFRSREGVPLPRTGIHGRERRGEHLGEISLPRHVFFDALTRERNLTVGPRCAADSLSRGE